MSNTLKLYESIINKTLSEELDLLAQTKAVHKDALEVNTSGAFLASYLQTVIESGLRHFKSKSGDLEKQIEIANAMIQQFKELVEDERFEDYKITEDQMLRGITEKLVKKDRFFEQIPQTSVAKSSLFTGNQHEPPVYGELKREIASADRVDLLVSFIKHSGLRLIYDDLVEHTKTKPLRIITTSYMGASDYKAILMLSNLPNTEVRISYDTNRTRLHAKAYYFHRDTGFSTAYIGSSNLSKAALSEGTEWNLKISEYTSAEIIQKYRITFETYWNTEEFQPFNPENLEDVKRLKFALLEEGISQRTEDQSYFFDLSPFAYQQEILDRLEIERQVFGSYKNLIVAATGTGKTIVSAFDFKRFYRENPAAKVLFLAHREEILKQSMKAYRGVLKDANFGELWVGTHQPVDYKHLFASIQTLNSNRQYEAFDAEYFDYIVVDETHHSASESYKRITAHFKPKILLGLTATPERLDGEDILSDFNNRIAYEIRLKEAIERNLLCPFHYFGVSDETDLSTVKWTGGKYDIEALNKRFIGNLARDIAIINAIDKYTHSLQEIKGLGFCVSKDHAKYMAESFNEKGIASIHLDSESSKDHRHTAQAKLLSGEVKFIFVVDLYNEGVDIPEINTVLFLRPTESPTIFIQQLGRGLRLHENKEVLTVLDFIGQAHQKYDFRMKFQSLVGRTHHALHQEVEMDFPTLPKNCVIQLERIAKERVLESISKVYSNLRKLRQMVQSFALVSTQELTLISFLNHYRLEPQDLYKAATLFEIKAMVGLGPSVQPESDNDKFLLDQDLVPWSNGKSMKSAFMKLSKINSYEWLLFIKSYLIDPKPITSSRAYKMLLMFYYTIFSTSPVKLNASVRFDSQMQLLENIFKAFIKTETQMVEEMIELVDYNLMQIDHLPRAVKLEEEIPLELHASYSTDQVLTALGEHTIENKKAFREGVLYSKPYNLDVFFITLNKSEKHFKESTRYEDYAINESLFHWQSQSRTSVSSPTGQRYINMKNNGSRVLLFVREEKSDAFGATEIYTCLGLASYVKHEGSSPISITYKLDEKMPMQVLRRSNQMVQIV